MAKSVHIATEIPPPLSMAKRLRIPKSRQMRLDVRREDFVEPLRNAARMDDGLLTKMQELLAERGFLVQKEEIRELFLERSSGMMVDFLRARKKQELDPSAC